MVIVRAGCWDMRGQNHTLNRMWLQKYDKACSWPKEKKMSYFTIGNIRTVQFKRCLQWVQESLPTGRNLGKNTEDWSSEGGSLEGFLEGASFQKSSIWIEEPEHEGVVNWCKLHLDLPSGDWACPRMRINMHPWLCPWGFHPWGAHYLHPSSSMLLFHCPSWKHSSCFNRRAQEASEVFLCFQDSGLRQAWSVFNYYKYH